MGFKVLTRKAKAEAEAKAKETAKWEAMLEVKQAMKGNRELAEEAMKKERARAKADAEGKAVAEEPDDGGYYQETYYPSAKHIREYRRYCARIEECGPFDLDIFPEGLTFGMLGSCFYHESEEWRPQVDRCVLHAIVFAKKYKNMQLEDPKVVRAFWELNGGCMFYITFDATDKKSGVRRLYEAKVLIETHYILRPNPDHFCRTYVRLMRVKKQKH